MYEVDVSTEELFGDAADGMDSTSQLVPVIRQGVFGYLRCFMHGEGSATRDHIEAEPNRFEVPRLYGATTPFRMTDELLIDPGSLL